MSVNLSHTQSVRKLYKTILRLNRGLPAELKSLGDIYVKDEFRRHKMCNTTEAELFMKEWTKYALTISKQLGLFGKSQNIFGDNIKIEELQHLRDEQIVQLYELMLAAKGKNDQLSKS